MIKKILTKLIKRFNRNKGIISAEYGDVYFNKPVSGIEKAIFEGNNAVGSFSEFRGNIEIGYATTIGIHNIIAGDVTIGKYCQLAPYVSINTYNHPQSHITTYINHRLLDGIMSNYKTSKKTFIGNDVWIGKNVIILDNVKIGNGAIIAAGSVVTKDIPPYHIAAGVPAKIIKKRFPDNIIKELEELKWWDMNETELKNIESLFHKDLTNKDSIYE